MKPDACAPSILEIDFRHRFDDAVAEFDYGDVVRMDGVGVQDRAVAKESDEAGVVRARRVQNVEPNGETFDSWHNIA